MGELEGNVDGLDDGMLVAVSADDGNGDGIADGILVTGALVGVADRSTSGIVDGIVDGIADGKEDNGTLEGFWEG